ncbi:MAG: exopolyphosphatase [Deltaproteobacteria bacterium]|nr:exopolyphosphatase [Deltaproteobacteria bacterium]
MARRASTPVGLVTAAPARSEGDTIAGVDLGSNSFHLIVARVVGGHFDVLDRRRERVLLGAGLDDERRLTADAETRALDCLSRFRQRLRDLPPAMVRAVGTNTLRQARDARAFLRRARRALGHPIEVISGREEARLTYLGVAHDLAEEHGRRLVVDIGGGSTEVILGERFEPQLTDSLYMGCVGYTQRFFPTGRIGRAEFAQAEIAAGQELQPIQRPYGAMGWRTCVGSSGTIVTIGQILRATGWAERDVTLKGLRKLKKALLVAGHVRRLKLPLLHAERASVLPGGLAILCAVFDALGIEAMRPSSGALREGLLYDLLGRIRHEDIRDQTVRRFCERYQVDLEQAARVEATALACLERVALPWSLFDPSARRALSWAARLHEAGLSVAHAGYHKHGAYLISNADLPGFSRDGQALLSALVRGHRRKLPRPLTPGASPELARQTLRLCVLLRLAVLLHRDRGPRPAPQLTLVPKKESLTVVFPPGWLEEHPLTRADLEEETARLRVVGFKLSWT